MRGRGERGVGVALTAGAGLLVCALHLATLSGPPLLLRLLTALLGGLTLWAARRALRPPAPPATFGSAGFGQPDTEGDLLRLAPETPLPPGATFLGGTEDGWLLALPRTLSLRHGCIVGGSGAGKSFSFFLPNAALAAGTSCVFADPKSELWSRTSGLHPAPERYAPAEPDESLGFNWVPLCREARLAEMLARAIMESGNTQHTDQAFLDMEAAFLAALFAHASTLAEPTPLTAYRLFTSQSQDALMTQLKTSSSPVAQEQARVFEQTHDRLRGSIVPVVAARLQFLRDPAVARFTSASLEPPDFARLRREPVAVYWCLREHDIARLRPLTSAFFTLLLEQLAAATPADPNASVPVTAFLDEFATLGVLPHFETTLAVARGRDLSLWLGLQSLAQLEARYGKPNAQTILTNCATKIALSGLDTDAAEYVSRTLGQGTVVSARRSWHRPRWRLFGDSVTDGPTEHPRPLLTGDEVRRLPEGEMLVVIGNRRPLRLRRRRYATPPCPAPVPKLGAARAIPLPESPPGHLTPEEPPPLPPELAAEAPAPRPRRKRPPPRRVLVLQRP